jgi:acyl-CoA reductase-like NAD-dependent aldehyde dehydrogenase
MDHITTRNPRTGAVTGSVPVTHPDEVVAAVARARTAFDTWGSLTHRERRPFLKALKKAIYRNADHIVEVVQGETGKHPNDAYFSEVVSALLDADYSMRHAAKVLRSHDRSSWPFLTTRSHVEYHPRGVAGIISPWNYPFNIPFRGTVQALAAGCTVVLKPSEVTPRSGALVRELVLEAGFPPDAVQVVQGGPDTGAAVVENVDVISFTGSPKSGKIVAAAAAKRLTPVVVELGGKDAMVILEDADLKRAARAAVWAGLFNAGQTCISAERIYVTEAVYDDFMTELRAQMAHASAGTDDASDIGPIIHPPQLDLIERHVRDAVDRGATLEVGGRRVPGSGDFFEPTLITGVDHTMDIMRHETFGPLLPVMKVRDEAEALELTNDSAFGLHGTVWTQDRDRGRRFASKMRTGSVAINEGLINYGQAHLPFGGVGESGYGSQMGPEGLRFFCYTKAISTSFMHLPRTPWHFPRVGGRRLWRLTARLLGRV